MVSALRSLSSRHHPVARATQPHRARVSARGGNAPYGASTTGQANYTAHNTLKTSANTSHFSGCGYDSAQGEVLDQWYFRARYFDAGLGRFISRDPYNAGYPLGGYHDGKSLYAAYFIPNLMDPSGLMTFGSGGYIYMTPESLYEGRECSEFEKMWLENARSVIKHKGEFIPCCDVDDVLAWLDDERSKVWCGELGFYGVAPDMTLPGTPVHEMAMRVNLPYVPGGNIIIDVDYTRDNVNPPNTSGTDELAETLMHEVLHQLSMLHGDEMRKRLTDCGFSGVGAGNL